MGASRQLPPAHPRYVFPSSSLSPMAVGASRSSRVLHRVSGRSRPRLGFYLLSGLIILGRGFWWFWLAATWVSRVALSRFAPFGALSVSRPLCLGALVKLHRVSLICRRGVCVGFMYLGICSCPIYGEKPCRNRRDEVGAGSAFGRLGGDGGLRI